MCNTLRIISFSCLSIPLRYIILCEINISRVLKHFLNPNREAFQNYRDLEIGANLDNQTNFQIAKIYGSKYFKGNFDRLVRVKTMVDPHNFFKHEQSIPPV